MTAESTPASPAPAPAPGPPGGNTEPGGAEPALTPEAARERIAALKLDQPDLYAAYHNPRDRSHETAKARVTALFAQAYPEKGPTTETRTDPATGVPIKVPVDAQGAAFDEVPATAEGYSAVIDDSIPPTLDGKIDAADRQAAACHFRALGLTRGEARELSGYMVSRGAQFDALQREHHLSGRAPALAAERVQRQGQVAAKKLQADWGDGYDGRMEQAKAVVDGAPGFGRFLAETGLGNHEGVIRLLDRVAQRRAGKQ